MREGLTIAVRDLFERLPLGEIVSLDLRRPEPGGIGIRLLSLQSRQIGLDLIVLVVFILHVIINARELLKTPA